MTHSARTLHAERAVARAAVVLILGIVLSGPVALAVVALVHPQPAWRDAPTFASALHPIQLLPYLGGFVLIGGAVALIAALAALAPPRHRPRANLALALAAAFAALIVFNYVLQTTFVPSLASPYRTDHDALIAALSMSNPRSLGWALEMWGYAVLGVATWAIAVVFRPVPIERAAAIACVGNGVISVAGGLAIALAPGWTMTTAGVIAYGAWNLWMVAMAVIVLVAMRLRAYG